MPFIPEVVFSLLNGSVKKLYIMYQVLEVMLSSPQILKSPSFNARIDATHE